MKAMESKVDGRTEIEIKSLAELKKLVDEIPEGTVYSLSIEEVMAHARREG